ADDLAALRERPLLVARTALRPRRSASIAAVGHRIVAVVAIGTLRAVLPEPVAVLVYALPHGATAAVDHGRLRDVHPVGVRRASPRAADDREKTSKRERKGTKPARPSIKHRAAAKNPRKVCHRISRRGRGEGRGEGKKGQKRPFPATARVE